VFSTDDDDDVSAGNKIQKIIISPKKKTKVCRFLFYDPSLCTRRQKTRSFLTCSPLYSRPRAHAHTKREKEEEEEEEEDGKETRIRGVTAERTEKEEEEEEEEV
jgi:hypothetical protein